MIFFNCESTCDLTEVPTSIYDRKMDARPFDTTNDIPGCLSFVQSLFEDRNAPIWRKGNRRFNLQALLKKMSNSLPVLGTSLMCCCELSCV